MKIYLGAIFLLAASYIYGQKQPIISGKVLSEEGIISGAYVSIGTQGGISDEEGRFNFEYIHHSTLGELRLQVSALGYRTQEFDYPSGDINFQDLIITLSLFPEIDDETAREDIKSGKVQFLLSGGIAPVIYKSDKKITRKYGVSFYEYGCEAISNESLRRYNEVVAEYLDHRYGEKWRKEVRNDIIGLN